jgi:glycosyltransferase involved in cell wall biosynthesis
MSSYLITVIIPAYNYASTLERAVSSVARQLDEHSELIVVDDGSTDNTKQMLHVLQQRFPNKFRAFSKKNGGAASARNFGITKAKGTYFVFLDADDEMAEGALLSLKMHIENNPETEFIVGAHYSVSLDGKKKLHTPIKLSASAFNKVRDYLINKKISLSNGACAMHKRIFENIRYPERFRNSEDIPVFAFALANCKCSNLDSPLAYIYKHKDSLRHHFEITESVGLALVEEVFSQSYLSQDIQSLKSEYMAQRLLSLFRVAYQSGHYALARSYYWRAVIVCWPIIFKIGYTKKFLRTFIKRAKNK